MLEKIVLYIDFETTGLFRPTQPIDNIPGIVQFAFVMQSGGKTVSMASSVAIPIGHDLKVMKIPQASSKIHGIYDEDVLSYGLRNYSDVIFGAMSCAHEIVAYNAEYDYCIAYGLAERKLRSQGKDSSHESVLELICSDKWRCAMLPCVDIVKKPKTGRASYVKNDFDYSYPKLEESYKSIVDANGFSGAHNALSDVMATIELCGVITKKKSLWKVEPFEKRPS